MDQFSRDAAIVGVGNALKTVDAGLRGGLENAVKNDSEGAARLTGPASGSEGGGSSPAGHSTRGMDTTTRKNE